MPNVYITVNRNNLVCDANATVEQILLLIRSVYCLQGGGLVKEDGAYLLLEQRLSDVVGAISYTGGQKAIQHGVKLFVYIPLIGIMC